MSKATKLYLAMVFSGADNVLSYESEIVRLDDEVGLNDLNNRIVYYSQDRTLLEFRIFTNIKDYLLHKLDVKIKALKSLELAYYAHIQRLRKEHTSESVIQDTKKLQSAFVESEVANIGRLVSRIMNRGIEIDNEIALVCYNVWFSTKVREAKVAECIHEDEITICPEFEDQEFSIHTMPTISIVGMNEY